MRLLSRYPITVLVVLTAVFAGLIVYIQMPFGFYESDVAYHAAKVLRASEGDFFRDPYSGELTLYPALYHAILGVAVRLTGMDTFSFYRLGGALNLIGLIGGFFFLARVSLGNIERASVVTLAMSLVFWAPSARYILLFYPSNFSYVFLLFGLGWSWKYLHSGKPANLAAGFLLQGLAAAMWWFNTIISASLLLILGYLLIVKQPRIRVSHLLLASALFLLPWTFVAVHRYAIREVIPLYAEAPQERPFNVEILFNWLLTLLTKGNMPYMARMMPWNWGSLHTAMFSTSSVTLRYVIGMVICGHFFLLVLPFNLLLLLAALRDTRRLVTARRRLEMEHLPLIMAMIILILSIPLMVIGNLCHVRRLHFIYSLLLLIYIFGPLAQGKCAKWLQSKVRWVALAGIVAFGYTVVYTTHVWQHEPPATTKEVIEFIRGLPDHRRQRLFFHEDRLRRVSSFVTFCGLVGYKHGTYFYQDIVSSERMFDDYMAIRQMKPNWQDARNRERIRYLAFNTGADEDAKLASFYRQYGAVVLENADWVIVDADQSQDTDPENTD